jgi:hypothetical protein
VTEPVATIRDLVQRLEDLDEGDRFEVGPALFARRPWQPDSQAVVLREDWLESRQRPGFHLLLDVSIAREVLEVWSAWRDGQVPDADEAAAAVIHYAENDAYQSVSDSGGCR